MLSDSGVQHGELVFVATQPAAGGSPRVAHAGGAVQDLLGLQPGQVLGLPVDSLIDFDEAVFGTDPALQPEGLRCVATLRRGQEARGYATSQPLHSGAERSWLLRFRTLIQVPPPAQAGLPAVNELPFAGVAHGIPALIFACEPGGRSIYLSQHWFEYTGQPTHQSLAEHWLDLIHQEDHGHVMMQWGQAQSRGSRFEAQFRLRHADGNYRWQLCRAQLVCNERGGPLLWVGMATEIEHQKRIEDALDRREREFRTLVENAPDIITRLDTGLRHVYANRAIESAFGVEPAALLGLRSEDTALPRTVAQHWQSAAQAAIEQRQEQECLFSVERPPGSHPHISHYICRLIPEFDRNGEPETVLCIAYDITQRRHAISALQESEQRFRQFAESSDDVFWLADPRSGELLYVSPAFERLWGHAGEELQGCPQLWKNAVIASDVHKLPEPFFASTSTSEPVREYRIQRSDGEALWIRDRRFHLRDSHGEVVRIGGIAEDITERKERELEREDLLERERTARAEAEALASAKDEFLAVVSHELRSPLNAIRGWAHVLRQTGELAPPQLRALDAIDRNTHAQARLVDDLLDTQRMLRNNLSLVLRRTSLSPIIEQAVDTFRPSTQSKQIALEVQHDPQLDMITVDMERMRQVLVNLISNAVKFTGSGGRIRICSHLRPHAVEIEVRDSGIGIEPHLLSGVFDRFRQADASSTRRQGGLGLGLSLARQLVELHGGRLRAHSAGVGRGAAFVVELPRRLVDVPGKGQPGGPPQQLAHKRIVVVEDDRDGREILSFILADQNADFVTFDGASAAFSHLSTVPAGERPHVLVSDIAMPEEDGYSFISRWRRFESAHGLPRLPAIALTAFSSAQDRAKALEAGFDSHIGKPIDSVVLINALAEITQQKTSVPG